MSHLILAEDGAAAFLTQFGTTWVPSGSFDLRLFKSNTTPTKTSTVGSFTEANFTGYVSTSLSGAVVSGPDGAGRMKVTFGDGVFLCTGSGTPNTIYGYYVTASAGGVLMWAERFDTAQSMAINGDQITITPVFTLVSEF